MLCAAKLRKGPRSESPELCLDCIFGRFGAWREAKLKMAFRVLCAIELRKAFGGATLLCKVSRPRCGAYEKKHERAYTPPKRSLNGAPILAEVASVIHPSRDEAARRMGQCRSIAVLYEGKNGAEPSGSITGVVNLS